MQPAAPFKFRCLCRMLLISACVAASVWGGSCSTVAGLFGGGLTGETTLASTESGTVLNMKPRYQAYYSSDINTADLYLTDLPAEAFADDADLSKYAGSLVHIHLFLSPKPGRTPIEFSATSVTIRQLVVAEGQIGLYAGGGFLLPSGTPGDSTYGGDIEQATLRLTARTPGFVDRLGACDFASGLSVPKDVSRAKRMSLLMERAQALMPIQIKPKILGKDQDEEIEESRENLDDSKAPPPAPAATPQKKRSQN